MLQRHFYSVWFLNSAHWDNMCSSANEMPINASGCPAGDHDEHSDWKRYMREHSVRDWLMCYAGFCTCVTTSTLVKRWHDPDAERE